VGWGVGVVLGVGRGVPLVCPALSRGSPVGPVGGRWV